MAEEWLNCTVWVSSEVLEATRANGSDEKNIAIWLPGKILDLSFINETDQIWRITLSLDSKRDYQNNSIENVDAENDSQPMEEKILTVEAKGALNQRNSFEFEGFHHRDPSNDSHLEYDDLAHLPYVNEPEILSILQSRYQLDQPFIFIGPILLAMNPFQAIELYDDASIHKYISYGELRNLSNLPPHVYKIADAAYHHMLLDLFDPDKRENQTIVITGDSGSGKTECSKYLVHYFCLLSQDAASWHGTNSLQTAAQSHVENTIEELVRSTDAITESLGNAKTLQNDNSSRFGKYIELSYSPAGKIEGVSIRTYLLECTRVTHHSIHERNFHIFYQLHAGLSEAEKTSFGFESLDCFHYLSHESLPSQQRDLEKYQELNASFDLFHISRETRQEMFKVFIGILHIGNIEFIAKPSSSSNNNSSGKEVEECEISSLESVQFHLRKACELMGYTLDTLRDILCGQKATVKGKEVETKNSISSALAMRDRLSKTLYYSLFKWIMSEINFVLSESASTEEGDQNPNPLSWIGILDIFGFENIEQNSLEQLCINYTHEKLKNYYNFMIFEMEQILYAQEGLKLSNPSHASDLKMTLDNSHQIDFFENPTDGLFTLLNESMKPVGGAVATGGEDQKFLQLLIKKNQKNPCFRVISAPETLPGTETDATSPAAAAAAVGAGDPKNLFIIQHYTIPVKYSVDHIIERNKGIREINFTTLSRKNPKRFYTTDNSQSQLVSASASSQSQLIPPSPAQSLTPSPSTHTLTNANSLSSSNLSTLIEKSSMSLSSDTMKVASVQTSIRNKSKTICSVYYTEVCDLIVKLQGTKSHFILCLKPNHLRTPLCYDLSLMRQQIQSYSIFETSLVTSNFISRQLSFPIFIYKYRVLLYPIGVCSFTKPIFDFLHRANTATPTNTTAPSTATTAETYRLIIISFIDLIPITHLILAQLYPINDLPVIDLQDYSTSLKVGQANSVFLLSNIFEILERLYYLTTDLIARKLQRIWKINQITKLQNQSQSKGKALSAATQSAVLRSLHYFNYFRTQKARDVIVSSILIQRKYRQYALRKRYLSVRPPPQPQQQPQQQPQEEPQEEPQQEPQEDQSLIKCQAIIRGWLCRQRLKKPKTSPLRKRVKRVRMLPQRPRAEDVVTADDFFPLVEGSQFLKVCRSGKTHRTKVVLTFDRRYLQWTPDRFSLKSPKSCLMDLADVVTLHHGTKAPHFHQLSARLRSEPNIEERSFSLLTGDGRSLDLIAPSVDIAHEWYRCLNFLIFDIYILREDLWKVWALMVIGEGIKDEVDDLDILDEILEDSIKEDLITIRNFASLWTSIQDPRFPSRRILRDIDACLPGLRATSEYFTFQAFFCLMTSQENTAFDPCRRDEVYQDMTQPLSHYFIHSSDHLNVISHATCAEDYLSSYRTDLRNGCRAIELHCWDGDTAPVVTSYIKPPVDPESLEEEEGTSLSAAVVEPIEIPLVDVLSEIKKHAFVTSPYPLLLFIENHCSLTMQEMIAYYVLATFGDHLVPANEIAYGSDSSGRHLPSPEDLFEKVILVISDNRHRYTTTTADFDEEIFKQKSILPVSPVIVSAISPKRISSVNGYEDKTAATVEAAKEEKEGEQEQEQEEDQEQKEEKEGEEEKEEETGNGDGKEEEKDEDKEHQEAETEAEKEEKDKESDAGEDKEEQEEKEVGEAEAEQGERKAEDKDSASDVNPTSLSSIPEPEPPSRQSNGKGHSSSVSTSASERRRQQVLSTSSIQTTESFYHPHLRDLTTLISRTVFDLQSLSRLDLHNLLSFSEVDLLSYLSHKEAISLIHINSHHLSRVYYDNRIKECHFLDPIRAWSIGSSMVLIDYHNPPESSSDIAALVGREKFQDNGNSGYVLKPAYLIAKGASPFPPSSLSVHLLSAQWIPEFPPHEDGTTPNPTVTVEVRGLPQDNQDFVTGTSGGPGRLHNPIWDEVFHLDIEAPDAAYLIFKLSVGDTLLGSASLPVSCLRVGFRIVDLYSNGTKLPHTSLTIRTSLTKLNQIESKVFYDSPELIQYDESTFRDEFKFR